MANLTILCLTLTLCSVTSLAQRKVAFASFNRGGQGVFGGVSFEVWNNVTYIIGGIANLGNGQHGLHIHESGDTRKKCTLIGDHYNPFGRNHSCDPSTGHFGDLGNVEAINGFAIVNKSVPGMTLAWSDGAENGKNPGVYGLSIAVDLNFDTCQPENDGNSAPVIACGRITSVSSYEY